MIDCGVGRVWHRIETVAGTICQVDNHASLPLGNAKRAARELKTDDRARILPCPILFTAVTAMHRSQKGPTAARKPAGQRQVDVTAMRFGLWQRRNALWANRRLDTLAA